ncbi:hypothetical protein Tco_0793031 [Tanacetum coccineum]
MVILKNDMFASGFFERAARTQQSTVEMHDADEEVARLYWSWIRIFKKRNKKKAKSNKAKHGKERTKSSRSLKSSA